MALIRRMGSMSDDLAAHAKTLEGPRSRGSVSERGLEAIPADREGVEFEPQEEARIPGCVYLEFPAPEIAGRLGAVPLSEALNLGKVCVRNGAHGYEMFVDRDPDIGAMPMADAVTVVLGPDEGAPKGELVVWTWHPGKPMPTSRSGITANTAVKVHNGQ